MGYTTKGVSEDYWFNETKWGFWSSHEDIGHVIKECMISEA